MLRCGSGAVNGEGEADGLMGDDGGGDDGRTGTVTPADDPLQAAGADAAGRLPADVRHPPWLLVAGGAVALAGLLLTLLGEVFARGRQFAFDSAILLAARHGTMHGAPVGPFWLRQTALDVTALGSETVLVGVVVIAGGFLAIRRLWLTFALVAGGTISGSIAVGIAKAVAARPRPALTDHLAVVWSPSFPSGHAANSAIVYLTLATVLMQIVEGRAARRYILAVAALLVTAIGCSRVYLGVHWPSDVIAGWSFGISWAIAWWAIGAWARLRRAAASAEAG